MMKNIFAVALVVILCANRTFSQSLYSGNEKDNTASTKNSVFFDFRIGTGVMGISGTKERIDNILSTTSERDKNNPNNIWILTSQFNFKNRPILLNALQSRLPMRGLFSVRFHTITIGVKGYRMNNKDSKSGELSDGINNILFWYQPRDVDFPYSNDLKEGGILSPVRYSAFNKFSVWNTEFFVTYRLTDNFLRTKTAVDFYNGTMMTRLSHQLYLQARQDATLNNYRNTGFYFYNRAVVTYDNISDGIFVGPTGGVQFSKQYDKNSLTAFFSQSIVVGDLQEDAISVDSIRFVWIGDTTTISWKGYDVNGRLSPKGNWKFIPVSTLSVMYVRKISKYIFLRGEIEGMVYWGAIIAPLLKSRIVDVGNDQKVLVVDTEQRKKNLYVYSFLLTLQIAF